MWLLYFKRKRWSSGFLFWLYLYTSLNFNKTKFVNFIELGYYNNINLWKITSCLNNLKWNIFVWALLIIFFKKLLNRSCKNTARAILVGLLTILLFLPDVCGNLYGTTFFFKKINVALLNGIVNIHPWLTFTSYGFLGWLLIVWANSRPFKKDMIIFFFKKNFIKFFIIGVVSWSIFLGGYWSFQELSWGGWWNWDVVELVSLNFFFVVGSLIHFRFFQFFKKKITTTKIILIITIAAIIVRLNLLSSIHAFINPSTNNIIFIKICLLFSLATSVVKMSRFAGIKPDFKFKTFTLYFNQNLIVITSYVLYYVIIVFVKGEDNVEWSPIIIFLFLCTMIFFVNNFILTSSGLNLIQIWPLNWIIFLMNFCKIHQKKQKVRKNEHKNVHTNVLIFMLIIFFIKTYTIGFNFLKEIFLNQNLSATITCYFGNNFFKKSNLVNSFICELGLCIYRNFDYSSFSLTDSVLLHFWKNSLYYHNDELIKIMHLNQNTVILLYSSLFLILPLLLVSFLKKKTKVLKIN